MKVDVDNQRDIAKEYEADRDDDIPVVVAIRDAKQIDKLVKPSFKEIENLLLDLANIDAAPVADEKDQEEPVPVQVNGDEKAQPEFDDQNPE